MIEAGADEIPDEIMYAGIVKAHEEIKKQVAFINQIVRRDRQAQDGV